METTQTAENGAEAPVWMVGDSWTYEEQWSKFTYYPDGSLYFRFFQNCTITYTVTATEGDCCSVKMTSQNLQGSIALGRFHWTLSPSITYTRELQLRKTDLAEQSRTYDSKGSMLLFIGRIPIPIPAQFQVSEEELFSPPMTLLPFPLIPKTRGLLPLINHTGYYRLSLYWGLLPLLNKPEYWYCTGPCNYSCEMEMITVPAGTYDAYNVSVSLVEKGTHDCWRSYYATEVGNVVKRSMYLDWHGTEKPYCVQEINLVSTTYSP